MMNVQDAILQRRTIKKFTEEPVSDELLERALSAGIWAQNHRLTEPWRFTLLGPDAHRTLAEIYAETKLQALPDHCTSEQRESVREKSHAKLLSKPRIVAVSSILSEDSVQRREDYAAIACAIQNIALFSWSEGLGMQWSTGKAIEQAATYELLKIDPEQEEIVGFLYFGYPQEVPAAGKRRPLPELLRHVE